MSEKIMVPMSEETLAELKDKINEMEENKNEIYKNYVLIRSGKFGCFAGKLMVQNDITKKVILNNCRRLYYWSGASTLSQLSQEGVKNSADCKFTQETNYHEIFDVGEIIPCTDNAQKNIREVVEWKQ